MLKAALVLEGGGMRGVYESGVLDVLLENRLEFEYVIGSSAGALNAANYVSKQAGRSARINLLHSDDPAYFGLRQFMKSRGSIFNFDYLFQSPVNELYPYDVEAFRRSKQRFVITATDCETGLPLYFQKRDYEEMTLALKASGSLPLASHIVEIDGYSCLDGGTADPIPVQKAIADGYQKIVAVLKRDINYRKKEPNAAMKRTYQAAYRRYPAL
ncbi:MAG: patatin family protein, partial [Firmicutes bacterium]|nr:patatin family protein [Bacillota bacterium]